MLQGIQISKPPVGELVKCLILEALSGIKLEQLPSVTFAANVIRGKSGGLLKDLVERKLAEPVMSCRQFGSFLDDKILAANGGQTINIRGHNCSVSALNTIVESIQDHPHDWQDKINGVAAHQSPAL